MGKLENPVEQRKGQRQQETEVKLLCFEMVPRDSLFPSLRTGK
jgi:hypothetical protein